MIIVKVVLPLPIRSSFNYILPHSMTPIVGSRVLVPFRSKEMVGIIISFKIEKKNINNLNFKFVKHIIDNRPIYTRVLLYTLIWTSKYYYLPIGSLFFLILPKILKNKSINSQEYRTNIYQNNKYQISRRFFINKKILSKIEKVLINESFSSWLISEVTLYVRIKFYLGIIKKILKKKLQILIIVPYIKDVYALFFFFKIIFYYFY
ncbi:hypothetical protein [Buchnera aphidicola]|uniref:primosomal protein N' family DNA-binding protein n=1 Tax=Buchnera aphidicola TaxID=9 RepID=UPI0034641C80